MNAPSLPIKSLNEGNALIYVIDDDASVREAIEGLLASVDLTVRLFSSALDFLTQLERFDVDSPESPNCLIVDVRMPGIGGLELQKKLTQASLKLPIIFISGYGDVAMTVQAMKAGARDFLPKPFRDQDMLDAVRSALLHDRACREAEQRRRELLGRYESLTLREQKVLGLVARGLMNKQIASELALSEITIKVHRGQLMKKMKAKTFADLVKMEDKINESIGNALD